MRKSLSQISQKDTGITNTNSALHTPTQHGSFSQPCPLLDLPAESLTHIASYLEPQALFSLGRANKQLYGLIKDDNTWHRAFVCQFLGIAPEVDLGDANFLALRRSESTWKREFVLRFNTCRRWTRSKTQATWHSPHHALVSSLHMLSEDALLSSSLQYGVVARSFPFTGRVVKGFLNASGLHHGLANGNPNAEFTPDVTACSVSSEGASARIAWGRRSGTFGIMWHPHTMVGSRAAASIAVSRGEEEHRGAINEALFVRGADACVTISTDGTAKIWSTRRFACVWTSPRPQPIAEPYIKVLEDLARGVLVCVAEKGDIIVYTSIDLAAMIAPNGASTSSENVRTFRVRAPGIDDAAIAQLFLDVSCPANHVVLAAVRNGEGTFSRIDINTTSGAIQTASFGDTSAGAISTTLPQFATNAAERSYIIAGDASGGVSLYPWDLPTASPDGPISSSRCLDVFPDASITALAATSLALAAGSANGDVRVVDMLAFHILRTFNVANSSNTPVRNIVLRREMLVASAGSNVMGWKAGPVGRDGKPSKGKHKAVTKEMHQDRKWQKQIQLKRDIADSRDEIDHERTLTREARGREREQALQLGDLGLSEREAVEYVLMLSREEALARANEQEQEEGVFELDDSASSAPSSGSTGSRSRTSSFLAPSPPFRALSSRLPSTPPQRPIAEPSSSNHKVQVSPRFLPEPTEAGGLPGSLELPAPIAMQRVPRTDSDDAFPNITPSSHGSGTLASRAPATPPRASVWNPRPSANASPRGAWTTPLRTPPQTSPPVSRLSSVSGSPTASRVVGAGLSMSIHGARSAVASSPPFRIAAAAGVAAREQEEKWEQEAAAIATIEDEELRFALELSLAEARSQAS